MIFSYDDAVCRSTVALAIAATELPKKSRRFIAWFTASSKIVKAHAGPQKKRQKKSVN